MNSNCCQSRSRENDKFQSSLRRAHEGYLSLSAGAQIYNVRPQNLWLAADLWDDYLEVDPTLGLNAAGVILSALATRHAYCPEGVSEGVIKVALRRERDLELVEVDVHIHRVEGCANGSFALLRKSGERLLGEAGTDSAPNSSSVRSECQGAAEEKMQEGPLYRWKFRLQDDPPGPSIGDAAEFIEALGIDPWSFESLKLISEWWGGPMAISEFEVVGTQNQLETLRDAHRRHTGQLTAELEPWEVLKTVNGHVPGKPDVGTNE